ncbi:MAG: aminomethyl-transferring glycine dehydrogenase subunit GcvPA [Anaerolineae bacterium]|nr:aminomethyl-transferring glycine dehydrogenase subunit GcvPA [Anaerolineae bacterium]
MPTHPLASADALFAEVPAPVRFPTLDLPPGLSQMEISQEMAALAAQNHTPDNGLISFLGAGAYRHYTPPAVDYLVSRGEFLTAYTPYQPEVSQGTLQAIFEYQTMMAALTGMEVSNASHYDGATAVAEAVIMAVNVLPKRKRIVIAPTVHPQYRQVVRAYTQGMGLEIVGDANPAGTLAETLAHLDDNTALLIVQTPNFFGQMESLDGLAACVHDAGALLCVVAGPLHLALFRPPGDYGADIVCGEGQSLGLPLSYGGPYLGYFCTRNDHVRKMSGRLVGETIDAHGRRSYTLTLSTREQHIRRAKATSNICSNQGLMALAAGVYMALMGKQGLRQTAELCYQNAHYLAGQIDALPGYRVWQDKPFFQEFVVACPRPAAGMNQSLLNNYHILGGYDLGQDYPHLDHHLLVCTTEMTTSAEMDALVTALKEIGS